MGALTRLIATPRAVAPSTKRTAVAIRAQFELYLHGKHLRAVGEMREQL